ncbi:MAG: enoyl-CoA hydratase/isomerase family protein [Desulfobacterales bacterium]|nr:enoyl-CoA hydratase/isomerase family protein [Desulfobacterales bacterium]MCP4163442.1 enoyl-CoA hydratase/isomerase family protein [Deltaproteobacteria bacterium]
MSVVIWEKDETVAIVKMNTADNVQNLEFADALGKALDEVIADETVTAIVLTSSNEKNFSLGVDINWVMGRMGESDNESIKKFMYGMNENFKKLLLLPVPTIAAINGHAFGNGAILSCACDFRFMREDRGYFCFPEVDLGIPFLPGMVALCKLAMPYYKYKELKLTGKRAGAKELAEDHVILKACSDSDTLMKESIAYAKTFTKKRGIFGEHKQRLNKHVSEIMKTEDPEYIEPINLFVQD